MWSKKRNGYLYCIDKDGDISMSKTAGGRKRKAVAKNLVKKTVKKKK